MTAALSKPPPLLPPPPVSDTPKSTESSVGMRTPNALVLLAPLLNRQVTFGGSGDDFPFPLDITGLESGPRLAAAAAADCRKRSAEEERVVNVLLGNVVVLDTAAAAAEEMGEEGR